MTTPERFFAGLAIGQGGDSSVLAICEREMVLSGPGLVGRFSLRHVERLTPAYPAMAKQVGERLGALSQGKYILVMDVSNVSSVVINLLKKADVSPVCVTLTEGGTLIRHSFREISVPLRECIDTLIVARQEGRFKIAQAFEDEAQSLVTQDLEGEPDALLRAVALSVWYGEYRRPMNPGIQQTYAVGPGNPLSRMGQREYGRSIRNPFSR